jgi:dihydroxyacetone kinase-like protein
MERISRSDLEPLFARLHHVFADQREALIDLDGQVGDSDLGLTMNKAFDAMHASVVTSTEEALGKTLQRAGMAAAKAAPSTMGTLVATGFMRGGKALEAAEAIGTPEMALFWAAFLAGVEERGKARLGEKTVIDVLVPVSAALALARTQGATLAQALDDATRAAAAALEATKSLVAHHGTAAAFGARTLGLQDAGATVAFLLVDALRAHVTSGEH